MPERKAILAKSNIKITHKFSIMQSINKCAALRTAPSIALTQCARATPPAPRPLGWWLGNFDQGQARCMHNAEAYKVRDGRYHSRVSSTRRSCSPPITAATRYGSRSSAISSRLLRRGASSCPPTSGQRALQHRLLARIRPTADVRPLCVPLRRAAAASTALPRSPSNAHGAAAAAGPWHAAAASAARIRACRTGAVLRPGRRGRQPSGAGRRPQGCKRCARNRAIRVLSRAGPTGELGHVTV